MCEYFSSWAPSFTLPPMPLIWVDASFKISMKQSRHSILNVLACYKRKNLIWRDHKASFLELLLHSQTFLTVLFMEWWEYGGWWYWELSMKRLMVVDKSCQWTFHDQQWQEPKDWWWCLRRWALVFVMSVWSQAQIEKKKGDRKSIKNSKSFLFIKSKK